MLRTRPAPQTVYLAGPILGMTISGANDWRKTVAAKLEAQNIIGISPLRCEPLVGDTYAATYEGHNALFGDGAAIFSKNLHDVKNCNMILAYLPRVENGKWPSLGSIVEIAWGRAFGKTVVLASEDPKVLAHPVVMGCVSKFCAPFENKTSLDNATEFVIGLLGGYAGGKNV